MRAKLDLLRKAVLLAMLTAIANTAWAGVNFLKLNLADGTNATFSLANAPKISIANDELEIASTEQTITVKFRDLINYTFCDSSVTKIDGTIVNNAYQMKNGEIFFEGLKAGVKVTVYNEAGNIIFQTSATKGGEAYVDTNRLSAGVYIVRADKLVFKFLNKKF